MRGISNFSLYNNYNNFNNYSGLFGSIGTKNNSLEATFNFADLATIRNGSYKRLLKAQTAKNKEITAYNKAKSYNQDGMSASKAVDKELKNSVEALKDSVQALDSQNLWKQNNGKYDTESISDAVRDFAAKYNNVIDQIDADSSAEVSKSAKWMKSLTNTMKGSLGRVGIEVGEDGRLTVQEDVLKKSDMKNVKAMFNGTYSYANQTAKKAGSVVSASIRGGSVYSDKGRYAAMANSWFSTIV